MLLTYFKHFQMEIFVHCTSADKISTDVAPSASAVAEELVAAC